MIKLILLLLFTSVFACNDDPFFDGVIDSKITEITTTLDVAKEEVAKSLQFIVTKFRSQGYSILSALGLDLLSDDYMNNGSINNFYANESRLYRLGNLVGYKNGNAFNLLLGLHDREPQVLEVCGASSEDFLTSLAAHEIMELSAAASVSATKLLTFEHLIRAQLNCLLIFKKKYRIVAELDWSLQELFKALRLKHCL